MLKNFLNFVLMLFFGFNLNRITQIAAVKNNGWLFFLTLKLGVQKEIALFAAATEGRDKLVEKLIAMGVLANVSLEGSTPLISSMYKAVMTSSEKPKFGVQFHEGHIRCAKLLLMAGANPNMSNAHYSPLSLAIMTNDRELVDMILEKGAHPNAQAFGWTYPILMAAAYGSVEVINSLISKGAHLDVLDGEGNTFLSIIKQYGREELFKGVFIDQTAE